MGDIAQLWTTDLPRPATVLVAVLEVSMAVVGTAHVLLHKQSTRAAVGWIALLWLTPIAGAALYIVFGINRIQRRARELRGGLHRLSPEQPRADRGVPDADRPPLARYLGEISHRPLLDGNEVTLLENGDAAYPAMLAAIDQAREAIALSTYIFDTDRWGRRFVDALGSAVGRGVQARVLVDAVGARYSFPTVVRRLRRVGVPAARFLSSALPWRMPYLNLRNHRKLLVVDGRVAFTGGMNLRAGHVLGDAPRHPVRDLAARIRGPVVSELMRVFATDWAFTTREMLQGPPWYGAPEPVGRSAARVLPDGPDEDFAVASWSFLGALACARRSVRILTPYFVPEDYFVTALATCALRGVEVDLVMPARNNLPYVQWASFAELERLVDHDVRAWLTPGPFDHSKLMVVDGEWVLLGSANWDARSLRLNFELNVEVWDETLARRCEALVAGRIAGARRVTPEDLAERSLPRRLRDNAFRLFKPYL